ncbi:hypothetical protein ACSBR2_013398 [Camellia fascicularis]
MDLRNRPLADQITRTTTIFRIDEVESFVSALTDGQNTCGLTMAQAPSDMV